MNRFCFLIFILFACIYAKGQNTSYLSLSYSPSFVFKHKKELTFEIPNYGYQSSLKYTKSLRSSKNGYEEYWGFPNFTLELSFTDFGDRAVLGHALAINPGVQFYLKRFDKSAIKLNFMTGVGYLDKIYSPISNITNNAISSHFNNNTKFELSLELPKFSSLSFDFLLGFSHFSNGKTKLPNSGVNYYYTGLQYNFNRDKESDYKKDENNSEEISLKPWTFDLFYGLGWSTSENVGGPQYASYLLGGQIHYRLSNFINLVLGGEREFHGPSYYYFLRDFIDKDEANNRAVKYIVTIGSEMFFGKMGLKYLIGYYLPKEYTINNQAIFFRLQTNYYPIGNENKLNPYLGIALKSHYGVADYISYNIGLKF
jgi:hypothetical protein